MQTIEEHQFWCWKDKLIGVVYFLYLLAGRDFSEDASMTLVEELRNTNADRNEWLVYNIGLVPDLWQLALAIDEEDRGIVFVKIKAPIEFQERIRFLNRIQCSVKTLEPDFK